MTDVKQPALAGPYWASFEYDNELGRPSSPIEALEWEGLDFEVQLAHIYLEDERETPIPGHFAVLRPDTRRVFMTARSRYRPYAHNDAAMPLLDIADDEGLEVIACWGAREDAEANIVTTLDHFDSGINAYIHWSSMLDSRGSIAFETVLEYKNIYLPPFMRDAIDKHRLQSIRHRPNASKRVSEAALLYENAIEYARLAEAKYRWLLDIKIENFEQLIADTVSGTLRHRTHSITRLKGSALAYLTKLHNCELWELEYVNAFDCLLAIGNYFDNEYQYSSATTKARDNRLGPAFRTRCAWATMCNKLGERWA